MKNAVVFVKRVDSTAGRLLNRRQRTKISADTDGGESVFDIDKTAFGTFLAELRRTKGFTQRELAEKLFVSDKAVSKWERGLSLPDISLLIPLSDIMGVSVTELLVGKRMEHAENMKPEQVETIVKKALIFSSEDDPDKIRTRKKRDIMVFGLCVLFTITELAVGMWGLLETETVKNFSDFSELIIAEVLFTGFGIYIWFFLKEHLPAYYDENRINAYSDGVFRLNMPGVSFNNSNWPYIVKYLRIWLLVSMTVLPMAVFAAKLMPWGSAAVSVTGRVFLFLYLASLFVPLYITAKKY